MAKMVAGESITGRRVGAPKPVGDTFTVSVDYSLSFAKMIMAGKYHWVNYDITAKQFPIRGIGVVVRKLRVWHFDYAIQSPEVEGLIRAAGEEPAPIEDLFAFGAKYSQEQYKNPIIALGSLARVGGDRYVACLDSLGARRHLRLGWYDDRWPRSFGFLSREVSDT